MTNFLDGPAASVRLELSRAPQYLRVVHDGAGKWDALDQLDDEPDPGETVFVYRKSSHDGSVHYCGREKATGQRFGRWVQSATYEFIDPQPEPLWLSNTTHWRAWVSQQPDVQQAAVEVAATWPRADQEAAT